jgi:hypothetical protein
VSGVTGAPDPRRRRTLRLSLLVAAPLVLVATAGILLRSALRGPYSGRYAEPFEREAWIAAADDPAGERFLMVDDLLARGLLEGLTLAQAGELLGPPSDTAHFPGRGPCWYLGPEPGALSVDSAWLLLDLRGDRIAGGRVVTD